MGTREGGGGGGATQRWISIPNSRNTPIHLKELCHDILTYFIDDLNHS